MPNSILKKETLRILGIDPGYGRIGIALLEKEGSKDTLLYSECFETESKLPHSERLGLLLEKIEKIIKEWQPERLAIETLLFSKNVKTAIKVAEARGVVLALAAKYTIPVYEFNPGEIKVAVTGYGKSDKKQIIEMVERILKMKKKIAHDDEYDAIAAALTLSATSLSTQFKKV